MIRSLIRILAFVTNWTAVVARHPTMLLAMIAGPFAVLFLFGIGTEFQLPRPMTILVTQEQASQFNVPSQDLSRYLDVVEETDSLDHAKAELKAQKVRLVILLPKMPEETIRSGRKALVQIYTNEIDPFRLAFIRATITAQMSLINNRVGERTLDLAKENFRQLESEITRVEPVLRTAGVPAEDINRTHATIDELERIPSEVLVAPFEAEIDNISPMTPSVLGFFTPAAMALVLQHLAVTLAALSMVSARLLGTVRLWRTAPVRLGEIVAGNYLGHGILTLVVSWILITATSWALFVPVLGSLVLFMVCIVLLVFASLGLGFVTSLVTSTEQMAAQMAMIILLASIYLGGIVVSLDQITPPVRVISYLLPATYGAQILQNIMIRGEPGDYLHYAALGVMALLGLIATARLLGRELRPT